ncbi:MAG: YybH family protein [Parvularculaceae bacterium]
MKLTVLAAAIAIVFASPAYAADSMTPAAVVDAFGAALKAGDAAALEQLLAPDVYIAESGDAERSFAEYASHHMPADIAFSKAVATTVKDRRVFENGSLATVVSEAVSKGTWRDKPVHSRLLETMTLQKTGDDWRIVHIHWSSAKIEEHGDH